jgi:hypothetical protein
MKARSLIHPGVFYSLLALFFLITLASLIMSVIQGWVFATPVGFTMLLLVTAMSVPVPSITVLQSRVSRMGIASLAAAVAVAMIIPEIFTTSEFELLFFIVVLTSYSLLGINGYFSPPAIAITGTLAMTVLFITFAAMSVFPFGFEQVLFSGVGMNIFTIIIAAVRGNQEASRRKLMATEDSIRYLKKHGGVGSKQTTPEIIAEKAESDLQKVGSLTQLGTRTFVISSLIVFFTLSADALSSHLEAPGAPGTILDISMVGVVALITILVLATKRTAITGIKVHLIAFQVYLVIEAYIRVSQGNQLLAIYSLTAMSMAIAVVSGILFSPRGSALYTIVMIAVASVIYYLAPVATVGLTALSFALCLMLLTMAFIAYSRLSASLFSELRQSISNLLTLVEQAPSRS